MANADPASTPPVPQMTTPRYWREKATGQLFEVSNGPDSPWYQVWERLARLEPKRACKRHVLESEYEPVGDALPLEASSRAEGRPQEIESGASLIARERERQVSVEGWTSAHDDDHENGEMLSAAVWYLDNGCEFDLGLTLPPWPWEPAWWKPSDDRVRQLVKAGALIAAEIDRLQRRDVLAYLRSPKENTMLTLPDVELVSAAVHEAWMASKRALGVTSRCSENGEELMRPYADLSEAAKQLDRGTVQAVYTAIRAASTKATDV